MEEAGRTHDFPELMSNDFAFHQLIWKFSDNAALVLCQVFLNLLKTVGSANRNHRRSIRRSRDRKSALIAVPPGIGHCSLSSLIK
jgi:DNA-binding FadR family transcriptional regulator